MLLFQDYATKLNAYSTLFICTQHVRNMCKAWKNDKLLDMIISTSLSYDRSNLWKFYWLIHCNVQPVICVIVSLRNRNSIGLDPELRQVSNWGTNICVVKISLYVHSMSMYINIIIKLIYKLTILHNKDSLHKYSP